MNNFFAFARKKPLLYLALISGVFLRLIFVFAGHYISPDGTHYALLGFNWLHHGHYVSGGSQFPDVIQPPLYPLLLGLFSFVVSPELGGKLVSLIFGLGLIAMAYWFVIRLSQNRKLAGVTALLVAFSPALVAVSSQVATESLFLFLLFSVFSTLSLFIKDEHPKARRFLILAGMCSGLAYLTRPEMIAYIFMAVIILLVWRKKIYSVLLYGTMVGFFVLLYALFVFSVSGRWALYPKIDFVRVHGQLSRYYLQQDALKGEETDFKEHLQRFRYSLAPDKKELFVNAVFEGRIKAPVVRTKEQNKTEKIQSFLVFAGKNWINAVKKFLWGLILPPGYLLFLLVGLLRFSWKRHKGLALYTAIFLLPTLNVLFVYVEQRFLYFPGLILMPLVAFGVFKFAELVSKEGKTSAREKRAVILIVVFLLTTAVPGYVRLHSNVRSKAYYYQAGQWLKQKTEEGAKIAAITPQAVYFARRPFVVLPYAPLDSLQLYLRENQVNYILKEYKRRSRTAEGANLESWPRFLQPVSSKVFDGHTMILLRVKKE
ncbi:ArnT family glycosyltransferase [Calditrichota bacterium GD2]